MQPHVDYVSDKKFWVTFFREAGFSAETAQNYSKVFVENRMTLQHLRFLTKDLLKEMGIAAVGDIITIIQYIKSVDIEKMSETQNSTIVSSTTPTSERPPILPGHELPVPAKRRVSKEIEGPYVVKLPEGKTEKTRQILQKMHNNSAQTSRTVVLSSSPSSQNFINKRKVDVEEESEEEMDNFEVTISSTTSDVRTANIRSTPLSFELGRSSVFDRLGAEVQSGRGSELERPQLTKNARNVLARFVNRSVVNNTTGVPQVQRSSGNLKRSATESIFSRLGTSQDKIRRFEDPACLPYQGVLKRPFAPQGTQRRDTNTGDRQISPASPSAVSGTMPRVSAKSRLGYLSPPDMRRSAGIFGSNSSRNVHERLGKR
ncbi:hypothetical protein Aperf_G00000120542 [Anoplocephala perfoliata]